MTAFKLLMKKDGITIIRVIRDWFRFGEKAALDLI